MVEVWLFLCFSFYPVADAWGRQRASARANQAGAWPPGRGETQQPRWRPCSRPGCPVPAPAACCTAPSLLTRRPLRPLHHLPNGVFGCAPFFDIYWHFNWSFKG